MRFNDIRQFAYVLKAERGRSYLVNRITNWSEYSNWSKL